MRDTIYITNRKDWRKWLGKNHKKKNEVWLIYYKRHTKKPRIPYDDAVEEALCYGWIDSIVRRIDDEKYAQKYTPRRPGSKWSKLNIERANKMIRQKKMTRAGLVLFKKGRSRKIAAARKVKKKFVMPPDLRKALAKNKKALENFTGFADSYKRAYILYIMDAKREDTRVRRVRRIVELAAKNIKSAML